MSNNLWTITETGEKVDEKDDFMKARRKYARERGKSFDDYIMTRDLATKTIAFRLVETLDDLNEQIALLATEVESGEKFSVEIARPETLELVNLLFGQPGPGLRSNFAPLVRYRADAYKTKCLAINKDVNIEKCEKAAAVIRQSQHIYSDGSDFHVVYIEKSQPVVKA